MEGIVVFSRGGSHPISSVFGVGWDLDGRRRLSWLAAVQPVLALCHAPSSPPELSGTCQNQSENLMASASDVQVWTR